MKEDKINIFSSYYKSIFDFNTYNLLNKRSLGKAFLYLLMLTLTLGFVSALRPMYNFNSTLTAVIDNYGSVPNFEFKNGVLDVKSDNTLTYKYLNYIYIIDTKGNADSSTLDKYDMGFLLTSDSLYIKDISGVIQPVPLSSFKYIDFTKSSFNGNLENLRFINILLLISYPITFFLGYLFNALIISILGFLINKLLKTKLKFSNLYKLSIYALTLPTTFDLIIRLMDKPIPDLYSYTQPVFYGVAFIFLLKALTVIKLNEKQL